MKQEFRYIFKTNLNLKMTKFNLPKDIPIEIVIKANTGHYKNQKSP